MPSSAAYAKEKDCEDGQPVQKSEPISPVPAISFVLKLHEQEARRPRAARLQKKLLSAFGPLGTKMLFLVSRRFSRQNFDIQWAVSMARLAMIAPLRAATEVRSSLVKLL